jgi:hypothetical protein
VGEQKEVGHFVFQAKLTMSQADSKPALFCESRRSNMSQTKATIPKTLAAEAEQTINFLTIISDMLKHQRRHFDDAVVTHCIRLINDYVDEKNKETPSEESRGSGGNT